MEQLQSPMEASLDFLGQLVGTEKDLFYQIGNRRVFAKNDFVFKAGEDALNVYVLISGRVKLYGSSAEGRDVLLWFSVAGEVFGLAEFLQEKPRQIYARAAEPCEVLCIARTQFETWLASRPKMACRLMSIMAARLRELGLRFLSLANGNIQTEIAQLLIRLGASHGRLAGSHVRMGIPLTEQDIADMVGSSRQGVSTCLAKMKRSGTIDMVKHYLVIKKQEDLHQLAHGQEEVLTVERRSSRRAWQGIRSSN